MSEHVAQRWAVVMTAFVLLLATGCGGGDGAEGGDAPRWRLDYVSASRDAHLHELAAVSADEGWALATETRKNGDERELLLHRDGASWRRAPLPPPLRAEKGAQLGGALLEASSPDDVWLFANGLGADDSTAGDPGAMRWDGDRWRRTTVDFSTRDVAVVAPDDAWALDASSTRPLAHHWDGVRWTGHHLPTDYVFSLSASGPEDVWAVGVDDEGQPAAAHFDGTTWRPTPVPGYRARDPRPEPEAPLVEVVALAPDNAWAFGSHSYETEAGSRVPHTPFALHWDGTRWREAHRAVDTSKAPAGSAVQTCGDGAGGFVLGSLRGGEQHRTAKGALRVIQDPEAVADRSGKITEKHRRHQHFEVYDLELVPGTREIWAAGAVGVARLHGDASFARGAIASYSMTD
ncbi:hypothetical protein [Streptomyces sp. G45]|uniref:hypothetical protein n=1 Tax=Streptomyces sp. G45 TaxID=3406627 RepID=UPI003C1D90AB